VSFPFKKAILEPRMYHSNKKSGAKRTGFDHTRQGCEVRACLFLKGHISKKIPLGIAVTPYLGFAHLNSWESATRSLNPKYGVHFPLTI